MVADKEFTQVLLEILKITKQIEVEKYWHCRDVDPGDKPNPVEVEDVIQTKLYKWMLE